MRRSNPTQPIITTDPLLGTTLGEYQVLEAIGEGGMGVVYRGVQPVIKKRVAIKVIKPNAADGVSQVKRLTDEAEAVNSIGHRNIIDIFSLGQLPDGRPYIVMEYLEGQPLDVFVRNQGHLGLSEVLGLLIAICGPLSAAHRAGVIHRDLKPSNIFVCFTALGERYLKLLDFGLAKKAVNLDGSSA
jgi:serine/threonine protein kinase